ncbi:MAG: hypothetical protein AABN33_06050 [Acidobacteriota bacterium]
MTRRSMFLTVQTLALVLLISIAGAAQSQDRAKLERDIEALREQLKEKELEFLSPSAEDRARFAEFLLQRDTGLARLVPREKYREKLNPLESVGLDHESTQYLAAFAPPTAEPEAREQQRRSAYGFAIGRNRYKGRLPVIVNGSYVLRCISYERFDVLVAFRVVRQDTDGSVILLWKKLREFSTPFLVRQ